ncbi:MAG TPA: acyltransferase family protein, partial [Puia sp.]|nr:acyltransferase family protein [Puia sp.]
MKKLYLEFVRGMAAIIVVVFHLTKLCAENSSSHIYLSNWGRDAVFIFFILSGCVINMSQALHPKPRWTFFRNRLLRLYPEFIIGVFLGLLVLHLLKQSVPSAGNILGNLFMLSTLDGFILKPIESNSPIWSLSYEMFFYLMFAFAIGRNQKKIIFCWLLISLVAIRLYFVSLHNNLADNLISLLAYSSIWLVGYYVYEYRNHFYADIYGAIISA